MSFLPLLHAHQQTQAQKGKIAVNPPPPRTGSVDVYGGLRKEMTATFDRTDIVSVVSGGKPGYANLKHLNVGSPGSDVSDLGDTADLEELLAQGSSQGPQTHPGIICCAIFSLSGFLLLLIVGCIVSSNSLYIKVKPPHGKSKSSLATSIFLAAFLYMCVFGTSIMYFLRARRAQKVYQLSLDVHVD
ncbi:uncharacterized protein PHALS_04236 [Plasmopara halstedii]|uniref:Transmembrane protein n=1 Tax=Plasmopara halstedii TaxID=4781 RepID=A0A0P1B0D7_PLAHL|nr:uncharacterized protein PHALS_04236 [Plasmopara halstedii]CEG47353.1 hypothetical protein PHALS_04236 [Plasmopara halstedii]|eukprot:XP_024583722.1 hypothetical protein PHALS_04236 [Plasmopara halstedii]